LTALGIGAVIGSGIFTVIGTAMAGQKFDVPNIRDTPLLHYLLHHTALAGRPGAGPALALSLVLVAIVCVFTGLCYAELASMIPIAGSAYTYTYATLGELVAWIIGWDLILEYAFSNMSVSVGLSAHIVDLLDWFGFHPPAQWISPAYLPTGLQDLAGNDLYASGWHFGFNIPAFLVVMLLTVILVRGIRESARTNNILVMVKIAAILVFICAAASFVKPHYWHPFMPNGWTGVLTGGSIIFFTYIGFDSVSTAAEECKNPQRDLPFGILMTLVACTLLYGGVAIVLSGIVPWQSVMGDAAPVVNALKRLSLMPGGGSLHWVRLFVLIGAMLGMVSSILVFQLGQARVWFAMSRDGLLPTLFSRIHPKFRTPAVATWVAGFVVGIPAGLLDIGTVSNLSNIGTLFAFVLVSIAVLILRYREPQRLLHRTDDGARGHDVDGLLCLAPRWTLDLLLLQPTPFGVCESPLTLCSSAWKTSSAVFLKPSCICILREPSFPPRWWNSAPSTAISPSPPPRPTPFTTSATSLGSLRPSRPSRGISPSLRTTNWLPGA
jgi:APA family basic amino acid/polyamine antiporter